MNYCLNPSCPSPQNSSTAQSCQTCGARLTVANRYRLIKPIGIGGFGRTFLAMDNETHRYCSIKQRLVRHQQIDGLQSQDDSTFSRADIDRFRMETQRLAELGNHPQIPHLLDAIEEPFAPVPALYLIQEWIAGLTLEDELQQVGPWNEEKTRSLLREILPVLTFIHAHQVIHRDLKPQNIIRPQTGGPLVLVDFGAAKYQHDNPILPKDTVIGSAGYAAPEQARGQAVFASDLYSLGVTAIHLLTGLHPFDLYSVSADAWVWQQYVLAPISPYLAVLLNRMIERCLNQRYRSATAILAELKASSIAVPPSEQSSQKKQANLVKRLRDRLPFLPQTKASLPLSPPWQVFQRSATTTQKAEIRSQNAQPQTKTQERKNQNEKQRVEDNTEQFPKSKIVRLRASASAQPRRAHAEVQNPKSVASPLPHSPSSTYTLVHTLCNDHAITALTISSDGTTLATGDSVGKINLWHLASTKLIHTFVPYSLWQRSGHGDCVTALEFSNDGVMLFSSSADGTIKNWHVLQQRLKQTLIGEGWEISTLILHPTDEILLSGNPNGAIDLWNSEKGEFIQRLWSHSDAITHLAISRDHTYLYSGGKDGLIYLWNLDTAETISCFRAHHNGVSGLALHPEGQLIITGGRDRTLRFWHSDSFRLLRTLEVLTINQPVVVALHPSGTLLAHAQKDTNIQLWRLRQDAVDNQATSDLLPVTDRIQLQKGGELSQDWQIKTLLFSPKGDRLVSGSSDGTIKIWQACSS